MSESTEASPFSSRGEKVLRFRLVRITDECDDLVIGGTQLSRQPAANESRRTR